MKRLCEQKPQALDLGSMSSLRYWVRGGTNDRDSRRVDDRDPRNNYKPSFSWSWGRTGSYDNGSRRYCDRDNGNKFTPSYSNFSERTGSYDNGSGRYDDQDLRNQYTSAASSNFWGISGNYDNGSRSYNDHDMRNENTTTSSNFYDRTGLSDNAIGGYNDRNNGNMYTTGNSTACESFQNANQFQEESRDQIDHDQSLVREPKRRRKNKKNTLDKLPSSFDNLSNADVQAKQEASSAQITDEEREELEAFIKQLGPNDITFSKAYAKRKKATKTIDRYSNMESIPEEAATSISISKFILADVALKEFVEKQLEARKKLGKAPMSHEEHLANRKAKEERRQKEGTRAAEAGKINHFNQLAEEGVKKKAYSTAEAIQLTSTNHSKNKADNLRLALADSSKNEVYSTAEAIKLTSTNNNKNKADSLRLALVDNSKEDGRIEESLRLQVESAVLDMLCETSDGSYISFEGGWAFGHRSIDCANEQSLHFFKVSVEKLNLKKGKVKAVAWNELNQVRQPRGWIWVPRPFLSKEKLMKLIRIQNPRYETSDWAIVVEGEQRKYGQFFLIRFNRDDLPELQKNGMRINIGIASSIIKIGGGDIDETVEPTPPPITEATACS